MPRHQIVFFLLSDFLPISSKRAGDFKDTFTKLPINRILYTQRVHIGNWCISITFTVQKRSYKYTLHMYQDDMYSTVNQIHITTTDLRPSVADPDPFHAGPVPAFQFDTDPTV